MVRHIALHCFHSIAPSTILVADDHADVRSMLREGLEQEGYAVAEACNRAELAGHLDRIRVDLITLDIHIGGEDGLGLVKELRSSRDVPVVMITDAIDDAARIACLERGADDHVTKPFFMREVRARIRNVLRRYHGASIAHAEPAPCHPGEGICEFEGMVLDLGRRELRRRNGEVLGLTGAEFNLLSLFVQRPAEVLSRDELCARFKGKSWSPLDRTIDVLVARLRKSIDTPELIKSVRGVGYVFAGKIHRP